jgi:hypothetical protein
MSGPPDKFPAWVDLSTYSTNADKATALGTVWQTFFDTYGVWPNAVVTVGTVVFVGAYS